MKKLVTAIILSLILFGCTSSQPTGNVPATGAGAGLKALGDIPKFDLARISGGRVTSDDLKGKVVVVDFWATWCQPCIMEIPNYNKITEEFAGKGVEILGITLESGSIEDATPKVEALKMKYPVVMGDDHVVEGFGGLIGFPTTFLVGKDGKVYKKYLGMTANKKDKIQKDIVALLAED